MINTSKPDGIEKQDDNLIFTGERYQPENGGDVELEHLHRYVFAKEIVTNKSVLDLSLIHI